ncbi:MAG: thymidylate kinase, partial [Rhodospirillales bacterium]|nr:thymidylate kinase [Rhodospirillales bacterium]
AARVRVRGLAADRYDRLGPDFHRRVAAGFRAIAAAAPERCAMVDGSGTPETVQAALMAVIGRRWPE